MALISSKLMYIGVISASFHGFENKIPKDIQDKFLQLSQDIRNKKIIVSE
ncbi:MAG TPA: hypothetical protein VNA18_01915 [Nitrososphaeraceae archaeon]|nr:hypothetical protein [Nitrososphaeraceae archaeon]